MCLNCPGKDNSEDDTEPDLNESDDDAYNVRYAVMARYLALQDAAWAEQQLGQLVS